MTLAIVDLLELVNIDVGQDEKAVRTVSAVKLTPEQKHPDPAAKRTGQMIELRKPQLSPRVLIITLSLEPVGDTVLAVDGGTLAVTGRLATVRGTLVGLGLRLNTIRGVVVPIGGSKRSVLSSPSSVHGPLVRTGYGAPTIGRAVLSN